MKLTFSAACIFSLLMMSCSSEKVNLSPVSDNLRNDLYESSNDLSKKTATLAYQSDISNLLSTFPKFNNKLLDREVDALKSALNGYIAAISNKDIKKRNNFYKSYVNSYIKIQNLRKSLTSDLDNILNRYMVRLKTNVNLLESLN
ncbi:hypothetical protein [Halpernia frigidisoli]|uniref:Uncharacterized protein n=1 Tax=Halpernia frigidisoli TaxID=1125876 RepID=A0A1I3GGA5_9FLAO|nr:hypothetical protein [Halpernia frigidisoli]SFI22181.1 hypothetical protein SAMN05443292_1817 [Halpernia frigidisoli]